MKYHRPRLLRSSESMRALVRETRLSADDFVVPIFLVEGKAVRAPIAAMPGYYRISLDLLSEELSQIDKLGLRGVLLFAKAEPHLKDNKGTEAINPEGLMQRGIRRAKELYPHIMVMSDVALDPYSSFGHDGIVEGQRILNDASVEILAEMSLSHARAGSDVIAPSDMMDGRVKHIREALEKAGYTDTAIMSYAVKYASSFYGPFRDALDSAPGFGDKKTYQMDYANRREALREARLDELEGADILMIKPAGAYLDIIREVRNATALPIAAYQVSGEYAMIKAVCDKNFAGNLDYRSVAMEQLTAIKRAGADIIVSYFAKEAAAWLADFK